MKNVLITLTLSLTCYALQASTITKIKIPRIEGFLISNSSDENGVCINLGFSKALINSMEIANYNVIHYRNSDSYQDHPIYTTKPLKTNGIVVDENGEIERQKVGKVLRAITCINKNSEN